MIATILLVLIERDLRMYHVAMCAPIKFKNRCQRLNPGNKSPIKKLCRFPEMKYLMLPWSYFTESHAALVNKR